MLVILLRMEIRHVMPSYVLQMSTSLPTGTTRDAGDDKSDGNTICDKCAEDYFVSSEECIACPPGTTNAKGDNKSGSDTACDPTICSVNEYVVSHVCTTCPPGTSNAVGNHDASGPDTECDTNPSKKSFMLYVWIGIGILGAVLSFFVYKRLKKRRTAFIKNPSARFMPTPFRLERENNVMEEWMTNGRTLVYE
jgi:hypothetical protein